MQEKLVKIGVFYDGNYFLHASNYYAYEHPKKRRLSINGLHKFIMHQISNEEKTDECLCKIVDAHYFRGRFKAHDASQKGSTLYWDRVFEDILMYESVTTHYLPVKTKNGKSSEKGIDVWFALEVYELALLKKFDVVALIACDGDYVPLVRKLNALGIRVIVLSWDFEFTNDMGFTVTTKTSTALLEEASYPCSLSDIINNEAYEEMEIVQNLFVAVESKKLERVVHKELNEDPEYFENFGEEIQSEVFSLKNGFGFIKHPPNNLFFHFSSVLNADFNELEPNDKVSFQLGKNEKGEDIAIHVKLIEEPSVVEEL
jgi:cold shock CspA family protein/uncharacterized LabA/DUF88 family protein